MHSFALPCDHKPKQGAPMKAVILILLSLVAASAMAETTYICKQAGSTADVLMSYENHIKVNFRAVFGPGYNDGDLDLIPELSNETQLTYKGISSSLVGHSVAEVTYTFDVSFAQGAEVVKGSFRSWFFNETDPSVEVTCTKQ